MTPILINTGRSTSGWSFWGPAFSCDFLWYLINVQGEQFISADALTQGSMGHTILAHYYARLGCEQGGFMYEGEMVTDPDHFLSPEEGLRAWVAEEERGGREAAHFLASTLDVFRRYRQREPYVSDRVVGVEMEIKLTLGRNQRGEFGLWLDDLLDEPELLDCPGLEEPVAGVPALQHGKPIVVTKRFDLVMNHSQDQRTYITDHKITGGSVSKTRAQQYAMDGQFAVNRIAGRQLYGDNFGGVVLNLVQRREPFAVSRQHVPATPWRDAQFPRQIYVKANLLAQQLVLHRTGQSGPGDWEMTQSELACYHRYGKCGAFDICQYGPEVK